MSSQRKWKLIGTKTIYSSKWLSLENRVYKLPDGTRAEGYIHLNRPNYVLIIASDIESNIVLERQYRRGVDEFVYELPAGWIENGESPETAALRELKEETGYMGETLWSYEIFPQPAFSSMKAYVVCIKITEKQDHSQDKDEDIKYHLVDRQRLRELIGRGEIKDTGMLAALELYQHR